MNVERQFCTFFLGGHYFGIDVLAGVIEDATPKLVVLQLAGGSATVLADFAILAHKLLSERIPAVVGFQYPVPPERARKFSECLYPALASLMSGRISDELYSYLAMLLAGTNRAPLLAILDEQLHRGRRPKLVLAALTVRPTDEQRAIVERWESR